MVLAGTAVLARARTDGADRMVEADELLAGLQRRCGGDMPGTVAVPQLLEVVRKSRNLGLRLARTIEALDGDEIVRAWIEVLPGDDGCLVEVINWSATPRPPETDHEAAARRIAIDRDMADLTARLDPEQRPLTVEVNAPDLAEFERALQQGGGQPWTASVTFTDLAERRPAHWRLLDGARCRVPGSSRDWTVTLVPLGRPEPGSAGFELLLVADAPLPEVQLAPPEQASLPPGFGRELTPVLRQPIARIIANAETIRARLAGPLADEYSDYAADIATAGQHLLSMIEDLSDLEVVEAEGFTTAPDSIDLADVARRAVGILGVRARAKDITLITPDGQHQPAIGEFRRVLQVLLNLVGNAINYSPAGSAVTLSLGRDGERALVTVGDEGPGLSPEQQGRVFEKFERLGRGSEGGSGLGLYISRRLARAMGGDLTVESVPGSGARFTLAVPASD
ncbi:sensor histidine kinase [Altererythrobacter aerius]|uniref:histidine kinase n=1 Tax=Tsuneonella aeria TaxID=1837929 RepID=A0A6I4TBY2_9SPHN|nr:HAMP domain-containing sensor histidine kinase [Tsuneonella aeria]MXO74106.1 sensor histidine kinase [Tsuneonella aeria]